MKTTHNSSWQKDVAHVVHPYSNLDAHDKRGPMVITRGDGVYVIDDKGVPRLRQLRTGERVGDGEVEVLAGLSGGETIASNPVAAGMRTAAIKPLH
mgnify:CR=1 FL=1